MTAFDAACEIKVGMRIYLNHLVKSVATNPATLVLTLVYVDRLVRGIELANRRNGRSGSLYLTSFNAHRYVPFLILRIVLTSFLLAHKYTEDKRYSMKFMAKVGGVSGDELKILEREYLVFLNYSLSVKEEEFDEYVRAILTYHRTIIKHGH